MAWVERLTGLSLSSVAQLGGHSAPRTWRPEAGLVGAELMAALGAAVRRRAPAIRVVTQATATRLVRAGGDGSGAIEGVEYVDEAGRTLVQRGRSVVLASGGFGFDSEGLMRQYRPDLAAFPTTLGAQTTGDGIRLAAVAGAGLVDMEFVQLHPTGFVDPRDRGARVKVLAAEVLRGVGGVLLTPGGRRFVNELGTRKAVTDRMLAEGSGAFWIVLSAASAALAQNHARMYTAKGLLRNVTAAGLEELVPGAGAALHTYSADAAAGLADAFGRPERLGLPYDDGPWWLAGEVTPVIHYTMGGVRVDAAGRVLGADGDAPIPGLFAAGEVSGGVHGENRLGGNSLLECAVFGRVIGGSSVPMSSELSPSAFDAAAAAASSTGMPAAALAREPSASAALAAVTPAALAAHASPGDCWTAIRGFVYDLSGFAEEHAGGAESITEGCGRDATSRFLAAHTEAMLGEGTDFVPIGRWATE